MELKSIGNAPKTVAEPKPAKVFKCGHMSHNGIYNIDDMQGQAISICRAVLIPVSNVICR